MQDNETAKVVVVGQGYVGLPLAMRAVEVGYHVVGFDTDSRRVELLRAGVSSSKTYPQTSWLRHSPPSVTGRPRNPLTSMASMWPSSPFPLL